MPFFHLKGQNAIAMLINKSFKYLGTSHKMVMYHSRVNER